MFNINEDTQIKINRIALLVLVFTILIGALVYRYYSGKDTWNYQQVSLFFTNKNYNNLHEEKRDLNKNLPELKKMKLTIQYLTYGPVQTRNLKALIPSNVQVKNLWLINNTLHINFSKEFIQSLDPDIKDGRLVVNSITLSLFQTFPKIKGIKIYLENDPLKTVLGDYSFDMTLNRKNVMKYYEQLSQSVAKN